MSRLCASGLDEFKVAEDTLEQENEIIDQYRKPNAHWDAAVGEEEMRAALKSSLRKKVASIEDDRWMFEGDKEGGKK